MNQTSSAAAHAPVDLRSDTVTHPTAAMYERMRTAPIGDDGLDGDPTVRELEAYVAAQLGKQAGLFVPSCTMANLLAVLAQTQRNEQVVLESAAHMYTSERGAATFTGVFYLGVPGTEIPRARLFAGVARRGVKISVSTPSGCCSTRCMPSSRRRSTMTMLGASTRSNWRYRRAT